MKKNIMPLLFLIFIPAVSSAQQLDTLNISNNSNYPISFMGDGTECLGQTKPHSIRSLTQQELDKLCKSNQCNVDIYTSYTCTGNAHNDFDLNLTYGVSHFEQGYPAGYIQAEGNDNNVFVTNAK